MSEFRSPHAPCDELDVSGQRFVDGNAEIELLRKVLISVRDLLEGCSDGLHGQS